MLTVIIVFKLIMIIFCLVLAAVNLLGDQDGGNNAAVEGGVLKFSEMEKGCNADIEEDIFKYTDRNTLIEEVGVVRFQDPMKPEWNYFECEIIATGVECAIGIGVGGLEYPLNLMPGWYKNGVGFLADSGSIFNEGRCEGTFEPIRMRNNKMGCGIEFSEEDAEFVNVFFTKNGRQIGDVVKLKKPASGLHSLIGMHSKGAQVRYLGHSQRNLPINLLKVSYVCCRVMVLGLCACVAMCVSF